MLLGQKGVKYGLQLPAKPAAKQVRKPPAAISAFQEGPDDEDSIGQQIARQQAKISTDVKVADLHAKALAEDPSIFDYDSHFDAMQDQKVRPAMQEKIERKSKYIEALKDKAIQREREQNVVYERRLAKERSAEDHLFGDKEKFVTAAYKKKLEEEKKWLAEEKVREAQEAKNDVVTRGHMGDFYRNILKSNDIRTGLKKPEKEAEASLATSAAAAQEASLGSQPQAGSAAGRKDSSQAEAAPSDAAQDFEWEAAKAARQRHAAGSSSAASPNNLPTKHDRDKDAAAPVNTDSDNDSDKDDTESTQQEQLAAEAPPVPTKEERIAAAKEKYLSRKRQKTAA